MSFADLASDIEAPKQSFGSLADSIPSPKKAASAAPAAALAQSALAGSPPQFQTNDPIAMRKAIVKSGDTGLLQAFDHQFPPQSASVAPAAKAPDPRGISMPPVDDTESLWDKIQGINEARLAIITGMTGGAIGAAGGLLGGLIGNVASGEYGTAKGANRVEESVAEGTQELTYAPRTKAGQRYAENISNAMGNLIPIAPMGAELGILGTRAGQLKQVVQPTARAALDAAFEAKKTAPRVEPTMTKPLYRRINGEWQEVAQETPQASPLAPVTTGAVKAFDAEPVKGGLPPEFAQDRADVLRRIGLQSVRKSAIEGDAATAARDYQITKFDEAAGAAAKAQFDAEKQALTKHAEGIVQKTGGTFGLDEDALNARGQTIAKPFDDLRGYFDQQKETLYRQADERSKGLPVVKTDPVETLLNDRSFNNSAMAQDKGNLVSAIKSQLELFKENNPQGLTVANAEDFRKWLNQQWSPQNKFIIGQAVKALDESVLKGAGEDLYSSARAIHKLEKQTLDNPKGVAKLMDFDPQTPMNRVTDFNKIPDTISRLSPEQFKNVVETLKKMPPELQPQAQQGLAEIKAHLANKIYAAGTKNTGAQSMWNAPAVSKVISENRVKLSIVFADEELAGIRDLQSAGNILRVDQSYPGAAAQAQNALKRGLMSSVVQRAGSVSGAGIGGLLGGPAGSALGAAAGEAVGAHAGQSMAEGKALKKFQSGVTNLSEVGK